MWCTDDGNRFRKGEKRWLFRMRICGTKKMVAPLNPLSGATVSLSLPFKLGLVKLDSSFFYPESAK